MNDYPNYIPSEFVRYYEFEFTSDFEKQIIEKLIFDERMAFIWSALEKRANEMTVPYFFYQSLVLNISFFVDGPNDWELLTQKEKQSKVDKISKLSGQLALELKGSPFDEMITQYSNHEFYINWFMKHCRDEGAKKRVDAHLHRFFELKNRHYVQKDGEDISFSSVWMVAGVSAPSLSSVMQDLEYKAKEYKASSVLKRKVNPQKSYFVRKLSGFFYEYFGQKLYNITATISSVFLDEDITQDEVISIMK